MPELFNPKIEEKILEFWKREQIFEKSLKNRAKAKKFVFYDGPPFASGLPHYGHILASTIKDVIPRYWAMKGFRVDRRWGWDCHGLPIENLVEQELKISGHKAIEKLGIKKFNEIASSKVLTYVSEWRKTVYRMGRFVDFENSYKTMDAAYMESVWWAFKALSRKNLVYKDSRISLFCLHCETPLSNFEIAMDDSYRDQEDESVYVKFFLKDAPQESLLIWTTTPWTLPGNTAVAVNPKIEYTKYKIGEEFIWAATPPPYESKEKIVAIEKMSGKKLIGKKYEPPFRLTNNKSAYRIVGADFVDVQEGTGLVHIAPAFGEEDFVLGKEENLPIFNILDNAGRFNSKLLSLRFLIGKKTDEAGRIILRHLQAKGLLWKVEKIVHRYPICWRCQTPLIYKVQPAWFIKISALKSKMLKLNEKIDWHPKHLKHGRFGNGLKTAPDWNVSRSRFWGTPLPIWQCQKCENRRVIGSLEDLDKFAVKKLKKGEHNWPYNDKGELDLHRPYIDEISVICECGGIAKRISDVFDCWFESGSMPFAQYHYPFSNKRLFKENFPADFISEYIAQTRGWFYTLHVISSALFSEPAFKHVITTGTILSEKGEKLSKSRKNFPDPWLLFNRYGADAMRYYLMSSSVMLADNINFSEKDVADIYRKYSLTLSNVLNFFKLYQYRLKKSGLHKKRSKHILDRWITSRLHTMIKEITSAFDSYEIVRGVRTLLNFIQDLSLWYVRRSRERIKSDSSDADDALRTLYTALYDFSRLTAPVTPFLAEYIWQELNNKSSVHLADYPKPQIKLIDKKLEEQMNFAREIAAKGLALRAEAGIKVRQPLALLQVQSSKFKVQGELLDLIKEEVNVKEVIFGDDFKLDVNITRELKEEGIIRELTRQIQEMRKDGGLKSKDSIKLYFKINDAGLKDIVERWQKNLSGEVGAKIIEFTGVIRDGLLIDRHFEIENKDIWIGVVKIS